ncbi:MAG: DUF2177 family protein [Pseudomonadota bacterium]
MKYVIAYVATALVFLPIDLLWLGVLARDFYNNQLGDMKEINAQAAVIFYLVYVLGIVIFAVLPAIDKQSLMHALLVGGMFGFFCYATYDLTNLATMRGFPPGMVIPDILWGIVLTGSSAGGGYLLYQGVRRIFGG